MSKTVLALLIVLTASCTRVTIPRDYTTSNPLAPTVNTTRIEFRVNGNASQARIRHTNGLDGTTQTITALPYTQSIDVSNNTFVTLEAAPLLFPANVLFPFTSVQIFVNGTVFRESISADWATPISVSGTYRK